MSLSSAESIAKRCDRSTLLLRRTSGWDYGSANFFACTRNRAPAAAVRGVRAVSRCWQLQHRRSSYKFVENNTNFFHFLSESAYFKYPFVKMTGAVIENLSTRKLCFMLAILLAAAIVFFLVGGLICEFLYIGIIYTIKYYLLQHRSRRRR